MNRRTLQAERIEAAQRLVGFRCRWRDSSVKGTITGVALTSGGWPKYVVAWDNAPSDWATNVTTATNDLIMWVDS